MINCMLKWNINCLKSNINAESCKQTPYDGFKHMSIPAPLRNMPWLKKQALHLNVAVVPKTEPFMSLCFSGKPDLFPTPHTPPPNSWIFFYYYFAGELSHDLHCHLMGWLSIGKQGLGHCNTGPHCHNKAAGRLYIPLCSHCILILRRAGQRAWQS